MKPPLACAGGGFLGIVDGKSTVGHLEGAQMSVVPWLRPMLLRSLGRLLGLANMLLALVVAPALASAETTAHASTAVRLHATPS